MVTDIRDSLEQVTGSECISLWYSNNKVLMTQSGRHSKMNFTAHKLKIRFVNIFPHTTRDSEEIGRLWGWAGSVYSACYVCNVSNFIFDTTMYCAHLF